MAQFEGSERLDVGFRGATLRSSDARSMLVLGVDLDGLAIDSDDLFFKRLMVSGVDVAPLVAADLN